MVLWWLGSHVKEDERVTAVHAMVVKEKKRDVGGGEWRAQRRLGSAGGGEGDGVEAEIMR